MMVEHCRHCAAWIRIGVDGRWVHVASGSVYCDISGTTTARP